MINLIWQNFRIRFYLPSLRKNFDMKKTFSILFIVGFLILGGLCVQAQNPIDSLAGKETKNLFFNLMKLKNKGIMFGHQDDLAYGVGWKYVPGKSDVKEVTGDYP